MARGAGLAGRAGSWLILLSLAAALLLAGEVRGQDERSVLLVNVDGAIGRATVDLIGEALEVAQTDGHTAVVLRLDTPGGGLAETEEIINLILRTPTPVIGYVSPVGARAVSAGTIILVSADLAAMAPFTTIGSVQPVIIGPGGFEPVNDSKIINFLVASLEEKLDLHGRNRSLAHAFVVENLNLNATEAVDRGATELVAGDLEGLLQAADGRLLPFKGVTLQTAGATVVEFSPAARTQVLRFLSDPLVSGLLLIIGIYALIFGLSNPGAGAEVAGVIMIILGLIGLGFGISPLALALIVLGALFLIAELVTPGFGALGVAGIVSIVLGTFFLAPLRPPETFVAEDYQILILAGLLTPTAGFGGFLLFALYKVLQVRRRRPAVGSGMVGSEAAALDPLGPGRRGFVLYQGEMWSASSAEDVAAGEKVVITERQGPEVKVRKRREGEAVAVPEAPTEKGRLGAWLRERLPWKRP